MHSETIETILQHRSIRKFTQKKINKEILDTLIASARAASTSSFQQCVSVIHVTECDKRRQLVELTGHQSYVLASSDFFVFCVDYAKHQAIAPEAQLGFTEQVLTAAVDAGIAGQNMLLAAESLGLGGVFIGGIRNHPTAVCKLLALPQQVYPLFGLCLGYADDNPDLKPRMPQQLFVSENTYQPLDANVLSDYDATVKAYYESRNDHNKHLTWSDVVKQKIVKEARPYLLETLHHQGLATK